MRKLLSCQFARRRQEAPEDAAMLPVSAVYPSHCHAFAPRRIGDHSTDCLGKGETESDKSQQLWAIHPRSSHIGLRPKAAALVKDDSRVLALVEPPHGLWRHSPCATTHQITPRGQAENQDPH